VKLLIALDEIPQLTTNKPFLGSGFTRSPCCNAPKKAHQLNPTERSYPEPDNPGPVALPGIATTQQFTLA
jgi:hypothetical protein